MFWLIPTVFRILTVSIISPVLIKIISRFPSASLRLTLQFLFCFLFSLLFFIFMPGEIFNKTSLIIFFLGFANTFAAYSQWKAYNISLSGSAIFNPFSSLISIGLGYLFLNEFKYLNLPLSIGIAFVFLVSFLSIIRQISGNKAIVNFDLLKWVIIYSSVWGFEVFITRFFAISGVPIIQFATAFYFGSFLGGILLSIGFKMDFRLRIIKNWLTKKDLNNIFILSVFIWLSLIFNYLSLKFAPITVIVPIFHISGLVLPFFMGIFFFREIKKANRYDLLILLLGIIGSGLIIFGYQV